MFDKEWFLQNQKRLLWLANTFYGRNVFCINGKRSLVGDNKIIGILPNAIFWQEQDKYKVEIRTCNKFSRRLFYAYKPVWKVFHWFDINIANPFVPSLNLGFDTTGDLFPAAGANSPVDGRVFRSAVDEIFSTIRGGAGTGRRSADHTCAARGCGFCALGRHRA